MLLLRLLQLEELLAEGLDRSDLVRLKLLDLLGRFYQSAHLLLDLSCFFARRRWLELLSLEHKQSLQVFFEFLVVLETLEHVSSRDHILHRAVDNIVELRRASVPCRTVLQELLLKMVHPR